jgi:hypothetical protein
MVAAEGIRIGFKRVVLQFTWITSPRDWPIVQRRPEHTSDNDPGLKLDILLSDLPCGLLQIVVQYGPKFAFHGTAPFLPLRFARKAAAFMPKERELF